MRDGIPLLASQGFITPLPLPELKRQGKYPGLTGPDCELEPWKLKSERNAATGWRKGTKYPDLSPLVYHLLATLTGSINWFFCPLSSR